MKVCSGCNKELPLNLDYFASRKDSTDGFRGGCRACQSKQQKEWRERNQDYVISYRKEYLVENRERYLEYHRKYYLKNKEHKNEQSRQHYKDNKKQYQINSKIWRENNKESIKIQQKKWVDNNQDYHREYSKKYREENIESSKEYQKKWLKENKYKDAMYTQKRQAMKRKLPHTLTTEEWLEIKNKFNNSCAYCGLSEIEHIEIYKQVLHQDHFIALTNGGGYEFDNIIPSCASCNASKGNKEFFEWYSDNINFNNERFNFINQHLITDNQDIKETI